MSPIKSNIGFGLVTNPTPIMTIIDITALRIVYGSLSMKDANTKENIGTMKKIAVASAAGIRWREVNIPNKIAAPHKPWRTTLNRAPPIAGPNTYHFRHSMIVWLGASVFG